MRALRNEEFELVCGGIDPAKIGPNFGKDGRIADAFTKEVIKGFVAGTVTGGPLKGVAVGAAKGATFILEGMIRDSFGIKPLCPHNPSNPWC